MSNEIIPGGSVNPAKLTDFVNAMRTSPAKDLKLFYNDPDGFIKSKNQDPGISKIVNEYLHTVSPDKPNLDIMRNSIKALYNITTSVVIPGIGSAIPETTPLGATPSQPDNTKKIWKQEDWIGLEHVISSDGKSLLVSKDGRRYLVDRTTEQHKSIVSWPEDDIKNCRFSNDGNFVIIQYTDDNKQRLFEIYNVKNEKPLFKYPLNPEHEQGLHVKFSPKGLPRALVNLIDYNNDNVHLYGKESCLLLNTETGGMILEFDIPGSYTIVTFSEKFKNRILIEDIVYGYKELIDTKNGKSIGRTYKAERGYDNIN